MNTTHHIVYLLVLGISFHSFGMEPEEGILAEPYRWARAADPRANLIVNDFQVLGDGHPPFFDLLQQAISNGVPFDGIGIQAHEPKTMRFPLDQVQQILDRYATLGKELHITEFTPTSGNQPITGSHLKGNWDEAAQADYATKFYTICFAHPAIVGITWWDLCDDGAWLEGGGMLHKDMSPKPVYTALKKLIKEQWTTKTAGKTDADGTFSFSGFHGKYVARISLNGKMIEQPFEISRAEPNHIGITLKTDLSNNSKSGDIP